METIKNRTELVFLYDIKDANPNGDPLDENKPRVDEETGINIVTDVRLKRTVRDYLFEYEGYNGEGDKDIFVREIITDKGFVQQGKERAKDFKDDPESILNTCIDIRLFGGVIPLTKGSITYTGPVQFQMGRSLHPVEIRQIKGTGAFAGKANSMQKTFRIEYIVPYSLVAFNGIVNETAAQHTKMTSLDLELLQNAMWQGTKNLISRSKFGQTPRLLLVVSYKTPGFFIGELKNYIELVSDLRPEKIRDVTDYSLDVTNLVNILIKYRNEVEKCDFLIDDRLQLLYNGQAVKDPQNFNFLGAGE